MALASRLVDHLAQTRGIGVDPQDSAATLEREVEPRGLYSRLHALAGLIDEREEVESLEVELELAALHPGDVEEIVREPGELTDLSAQDVVHAGGDLAVLRLEGERVDCTLDRCQRIAQLVTDDAEQCILGLDLLLRQRAPTALAFPVLPA
jgi:hypothetical protein